MGSLSDLPISMYPKTKKKVTAQNSTVINDGNRNQEVNATESTLSMRSFQFIPEHPKYSIHSLKLQSVPIIPIILGWGIPHRDKDETQDTHVAAMLMLFQTWSSDEASLLKASDISRSDAYNDFLIKASPKIIKIIDNM